MKRIVSFMLVAVIMVMSFTSCDLVNQFLGNQSGSNGDSGTNETRYTITAEEWDAMLNMKNYTKESTGSTTVKDLDGNPTTYPNDSFEENTETAMHIKGVSIPGPNDFEYYVTQKDDKTYRVNTDPADGTVISAYEYTFEASTFGNGLGVTFEDLNYDEEKKGYLASFVQYGMTCNYEFYFENGKIVKVIGGASSDDGFASSSTMIITNIGTTVVNALEFTIEENN